MPSTALVQVVIVAIAEVPPVSWYLPGPGVRSMVVALAFTVPTGAVRVRVPV